MPKYDDQDYRAVSQALVPVEGIDHDLMGEIADQTPRLRKYLASVLLDNPDWWPWVIRRWASHIADVYTEWEDLLERAISGLEEGNHANLPQLEVPSRLRHSDISRMSAQIRQSLGEVPGGLRYSLKEMVDILDRVVSLSASLPELVDGDDWTVVDEAVLEYWSGQTSRSNLEQTVRDLADSPRAAWLALATVQRQWGLSRLKSRPYGNEVRDVVTLSWAPPYKIPARVTSTGQLPSEEDSQTITYSLDGGSPKTIDVAGASRAQIVSVQEPFVFTQNVQAQVRTVAVTASFTLSSTTAWEIYLDGVRYTRDIPSGTYTEASIVPQLRLAQDSAGNYITGAATIVYDSVNKWIVITKYGYGGSIVVGDGYGGTCINSYIGFTDWDDSDDASNSRTVAGQAANNVIELKMNGEVGTTLVSVTAGTYTAAQVVAALSGHPKFDVDVFDLTRVRFRSKIGGARSRIEVVEDQKVLGLRKGFTTWGAPVTFASLQRDIGANHPELTTRLAHSPVYVSQATVASSAKLSVSETSGIEVGMVAYFLSGKDVAAVFEVTAVSASSGPGTVMVSPSIQQPVGDVVRVQIGWGTFVLEADPKWGELVIVSGEPYFPTSTTTVRGVAEDDRLQVQSASRSMKYVRQGDYLENLGWILQEVSSTAVRVDSTHPVDTVVQDEPVRSMDWKYLLAASFPAPTALKSLNKFAGYVSAYRNRPSSDLRMAMLSILNEFKDWAVAVIGVATTLKESIRDLQVLVAVIDMLSGEGYDIAAEAFTTSPGKVEDLFPADGEDVDSQTGEKASRSWDSSELVASLARAVVTPPQQLDHVDVGTVKVGEEDGDDDVDVNDYVTSDLFDGEGEWWE